MQVGPAAGAAPADMQQQSAPPLCLTAFFPDGSHPAADTPAASLFA
jgi:hypothetical protein